MSQDGLRLSLSTAGQSADVHVIRVDGVVDTVTSPELDSVIGSLVEQRRYRIVIDLAGTNYISSAGWGIFISRLREIREGGGDLKLARMTTDVREIFDLLEFDGILPCHERLDAAQAAFGGGNGGNGDSGNGHGKSPSLTLVSPRPAASTSTFEPTHLPTPPPAPAAPASVESAILQLVVEDPFYRLGEIKDRLDEIGFHKVGRWTIWKTLRKHKLTSRRRRFRYGRRQSTFPFGG